MSEQNDEIMRQALAELREAVEELSDEDLHWLTLYATLGRGAAPKETTAPTGENMMFPDPDFVPSGPPRESQSRFWNAMAMVLVAERDRRRAAPNN